MLRSSFACAALALASGAAQAAFIGVEMRTDSAWNASATSTINTALGTSGAYHVVRLYAVFNTTETVLSVGQVGGANGFGLGQITGTTFYQEGDPFGGDTAPSGGFFGLRPSLQWDTYVSVGRVTSNPSGDATALDGSFAFQDLGGAPGEDFIAGGWFNSNPTNGQGATTLNAQSGLREVFLGQVTMKGLGAAPVGAGPGLNISNNVFSGQMTVFRQIPGGGADAFTVNFSYIPTPGAAAMLGIAGVAAMRRRRSA